MSTDHARLDGKIAIVTGGTQGLGAAIAHSLPNVAPPAS